jgi:hypothetical protein
MLKNRDTHAETTIRELTAISYVGVQLETMYLVMTRKGSQVQVLYGPPLYGPPNLSLHAAFGFTSLGNYRIRALLYVGKSSLVLLER